MQGETIEEGCRHLIFARERIDRVETHCGEDIPCGHLSTVLIATEPIRAVGVERRAYLMDEVSCLPGLIHIVVEEDHVVARLVALDILPDHTRREDRELYALRRRTGEELIETVT